RGVGVRGRDGARLAGRAAGGLGRAVAPVDRIRPGRVVRPGIAEGDAERDRAAQRDGLVRSRVHRGRHIADSGGGRGRAAPRSARVGDGEGDRVRAVVRVRVRGPDTGAGGPVAEAAGIRERVAIRVRRAAAVEAHGRALGAGVRSARYGGGWVIDATGGVMAAAAARIGEGLAGYGS